MIVAAPGHLAGAPPIFSALEAACMRNMVLTKAERVRGEQKVAGHQFSVSEKEARLWEALGRAKPDDATASDDAASTTNSTDAVAETERLRAEYKARSGQNADASWTIGRLKNELRRGRYNRRDMRAED